VTTAVFFKDISVTYLCKTALKHDQPWRFQGTRKQWLRDQKEVYEQAVQGGYAKDCIMDVQGRYLKR